MKRTRTISGWAGMLAVAMLVGDSWAMYNPSTGRFVQRGEKEKRGRKGVRNLFLAVPSLFACFWPPPG